MYNSFEKIYEKSFPSSRSGALYNTFSYPTKISPEAIAIFIASHTKPGDTILDVFGGSGTTGLATILCSNPTEEVIKLAEKMEVPVEWGPRKAYIYELSTLGALISTVMCNPPDPEIFKVEAHKLIEKVTTKYGWMYEIKDTDNNAGVLRHAIWSEVLECNNCGSEISYWDNSVTLSPLEVKHDFCCPKCGFEAPLANVKRATESYFDDILGESITRKKRELKRIYGQTGKSKWSREVTENDIKITNEIENIEINSYIPVQKIQWGDLYRSGYHTGITHAHHFYTRRNLTILSALWEKINEAPSEYQDALKLLVLSYNSSHSTLMTRVVKKKSEKDFVLTGAQSGVLYISNLPVEKNILTGLLRKIETFYKAFKITYDSESIVKVIQGSSTNLTSLENNSVDYIFTDPPFGDFIPYSELNFLNEVWLGECTDKSEEAIISSSQNKGLEQYENLMNQVFKEMYRVLKKEKFATVVFHAAKSSIWNALQNSYRDAGFIVRNSSILDKLQGSFKQVISTNSVSGDPLILLQKSGDSKLKTTIAGENEILAQLIENNENLSKEHLYSYFVNYYLENGLPVPLDAKKFYEIIDLSERV